MLGADTGFVEPAARRNEVGGWNVVPPGANTSEVNLIKGARVQNSQHPDMKGSRKVGSQGSGWRSELLKIQKKFRAIVSDIVWVSLVPSIQAATGRLSDGRIET